MERTIDHLLIKYGESHQDTTNKLIHWICVPSIMFSLFGVLMSIPFFVEKTIYYNWAAVVLLLALGYYLTLSISMFIGFIIVGGLMLYGNYAILSWVNGSDWHLFLVSIAIFTVAWIGQFIGHGIEGKKPSFFDDIKFLLIGPAWLLHFIYRKVGIPY